MISSLVELMFESYRRLPTRDEIYPQVRMKSAQRSPTMIAGALVLARGIRGSAEASATRRPATPRTRSCGSSTLSGSVPIAAEHAGWAVVATVARTHASSSSSVFTSGPGWNSRATADANGSVDTISRVRLIARTKASRSPRAVRVFSWIAGGSAASGERTITLPRLSGVQYDCTIDIAGRGYSLSSTRMYIGAWISWKSGAGQPGVERTCATASKRLLVSLPVRRISQRSNHFGLLASANPMNPGASSQFIIVAGGARGVLPPRRLAPPGSDPPDPRRPAGPTPGHRTHRG